MEVASAAGDRPSTRQSGGGAKTACSRPGPASPTTPSVAAVAADRTTWIGSVGVGSKTDANSTDDRLTPPAPPASTARPPSSRTSPSVPDPVTCTEYSRRSGEQGSRTDLPVQTVLALERDSSTTPSPAVPPTAAMSYDSSTPSTRSSDASSDSRDHARPEGSASTAPRAPSRR